MNDQRQDMRPAGPAPDVMDGYVTREELAGRIGVSPDTLKRWATQRKGPPCVYVGRTPYYRVEAYREWLLSKENKSWGEKR